MRIAAATIEDAPSILELVRGLAEYERLSHVVTATEQQIRDTLFGSRPAAEVLLASLEGEHVGLAVFFTTYSTFLGRSGLYLEDLFVKPQARGKGIGRALFERLAQVAVERNCGRVELDVLNWNEPSLRFFQKLGAVPLGEWTCFRLSGEALANLAGKRGEYLSEPYKAT